MATIRAEMPRITVRFASIGSCHGIGVLLARFLGQQQSHCLKNTGERWETAEIDAVFSGRSERCRQSKLSDDGKSSRTSQKVIRNLLVDEDAFWMR
jgi:hypothetical protein